MLICLGLLLGSAQLSGSEVRYEAALAWALKEVERSSLHEAEAIWFSPDEARARFIEVRRKYGDRKEAVLGQARAEFNSGDYASAEQNFKLAEDSLRAKRAQIHEQVKSVAARLSGERVVSVAKLIPGYWAAMLHHDSAVSKSYCLGELVLLRTGSDPEVLDSARVDQYHLLQLFALELDGKPGKEAVIEGFDAGTGFEAYVLPFTLEAETLRPLKELHGRYGIEFEDLDRDRIAEVLPMYKAGQLMANADRGIWQEVYSYKGGAIRHITSHFPEVPLRYKGRLQALLARFPDHAELVACIAGLRALESKWRESLKHYQSALTIERDEHRTNAVKATKSKRYVRPSASFHPFKQRS